MSPPAPEAGDPPRNARTGAFLCRGGLWIATAAVLVVLASVAGAYHLSAGVSDSVGTSGSETPTDPSVGPEMRERGLARDCYEPEAGEPDPQAALASDAFCGRLVYEQGTSKEQVSPPDQDLRGPIASFDVVYANYIGTYGIGTCSPWCFPGGEAVYRSGHDAGAQAGLTPTGEEAYAQDQGWQTYGAAIAHPNALALLHDTTGAWPADGWVHPVPDQSFVGVLADEEGAPIDDGRLASIVEEHPGLPEDAAPRVCGFTPDAEIGAADAGANVCEVSLTWQAPSEDGGDGACRSPTYTCGAVQPAWRARTVCSAVALQGGCGGGPSPTGDPLAGDRSGPAASTGDHDVWHWVVAPTPSDCGGAQEPGFDVAPAQASFPYLAHDLDVYTPIASAAGIESGENLEAMALAQAEASGGSPPGLPGAPDPGQALEGPTGLVAKEDRVEPNARGDSSQTNVQIDRDLAEDPCREIVATSEEPAYVDPWVDVIDAQVYRNLWLDSILGTDPWIEGLDRRTYQQPPVTSAFGDANDAYLTEDDDQDASNRPGPWMYSAGGKLGVFTDKDDDGRYDQAPNSRLFDAIDEAGAYPLFWDMRVDEHGNVDPDAGCRLDGDTRLAEAMSQAGYGPRTGLVMVVHKTEPTVLYDWRTSQAFPQPAPEQAYVLLSQSLHAQREDPVVQEAIETTLERLETPISPDDERVVYPGDQTAPASDFYEQCGYPTGGFHTSWSFTHTPASPGETIVTSYLLENTAADGLIGEQGPIPPFQPAGEEHAFDAGIQQWFDVDPIDGAPERNTDTCSAPPHPGQAC